MPIYADIYDGPPRWYTQRRTDKKYVMIHATANDASAENEASFAKRRTSRVSSHYYVDDDSIVQSLDTDYRAWHAGNTEGNDHAIAYELTARNMNVGRSWWVDIDNIEWPLMVAAIARDCAEHGIEPRELSDGQLRAGNMTGFTTHVQGNRVWGGSDHTDPGPNFPMNHLVSQVRAAMEDDMAWGQRLPVAGWVQDEWGRWPDGTISAESALVSGYGWSRLAADRSAELLAGQAAILGRLDGADDDTTRQLIREELKRSRGMLLDSVEELLRQHGSGELTAEQVVDELSRRLDGQDAEESTG